MKRSCAIFAFCVSAGSPLPALEKARLVAAELLRREIQASLTLGNAKAIDIFAHNPRARRTFNVQVKTLRQKNVFLIAYDDVGADEGRSWVDGVVE